MTKEEILFSFPRGESEPYGQIPVNRIYEAMEQYAKQEATKFLKSVLNTFRLESLEKMSKGELYITTDDGSKQDITFEQLYELYKQQSNE